MSSRTRSRRPVSIGSNQSSRRWTAVSASDCRASDFMLLLVMAWSPPALKRRLYLGFNHPETTPPSIPTTPRTAPARLVGDDNTGAGALNHEIVRVPHRAVEILPRLDFDMIAVLDDRCRGRRSLVILTWTDSKRVSTAGTRNRNSHQHQHSKPRFSDGHLCDPARPESCERARSLAESGTDATTANGSAKEDI